MWSKQDQSWILSGFFFGYLVTSLIGGALSERFGGRHVVGGALLVSGILTGISPLVAQDNFLPTFLVRVALGVFGVGHQISHHYSLSWSNYHFLIVTNNDSLLHAKLIWNASLDCHRKYEFYATKVKLIFPGVDLSWIALFGCSMVTSRWKGKIY